jgi:hypothetical protein
LASRTLSGPNVFGTVFGGADLRQCATTDPKGSCPATGPAGFSLTSVPEPAGWGLMLLGFGTVGALIRRRRASLSAA